MVLRNTLIWLSDSILSIRFHTDGLVGVDRLRDLHALPIAVRWTTSFGIIVSVPTVDVLRDRISQALGATRNTP